MSSPFRLPAPSEATAPAEALGGWVIGAVRSCGLERVVAAVRADPLTGSRVLSRITTKLRPRAWQLEEDISTEAESADAEILLVTGKTEEQLREWCGLSLFGDATETGASGWQYLTAEARADLGILVRTYGLDACWSVVRDSALCDRLREAERPIEMLEQILEERQGAAPFVASPKIPPNGKAKVAVP